MDRRILVTCLIIAFIVGPLVLLFGTGGQAGAEAPSDVAATAGITWNCSRGDAGFMCASTSLAPMPTARDRFGLATASDGKLYAIGGQVKIGGNPVSTVEAYDPVGNTWTCSRGDTSPGCTSASLAPMPTARLLLGLVAANGKLYAIGGAVAGAFVDFPVSTVEVYDPVRNTWTCSVGDTGSGCAAKNLAPMPTARDGFGLGVAATGSLFAIGGLSGSGVTASVEAYNPVANTWICSRGDTSAGCRSTTLSAMPTGRWGLGLVAALNGILFSFGGRDKQNNSTNTAEAYNPARNTWTCSTGDTSPGCASTNLAPMPTRRFFFGLVVPANGSLYAVGGVGLANGSITTVEAYDPVLNNWTCSLDDLNPGCTSYNLTSMPSARYALGIGAVNDGSFYAIGGANQTAVLSMVEQASFLANPTSTPTPTPSGTATASATPSATTSATSTITSTSTGTATPSPTPSASSTSTTTSSVTATTTNSTTSTATPTATPSASATSTTTNSSTSTATPTATSTSSITSTATSTATPTNSATVTSTSTPTNTPPTGPGSPACLNTSPSPTPIGGNQSTSTLAPGAYEVTSLLQVPNGITWTLSSGVTLCFADGTALDVQSGSTLTASSSGQSPAVTFTSANATPGPGQWGGLYFQSGAGGTLQNAIVEDAGQNVVFAAAFGIRIDTSSGTPPSVILDGAVIRDSAADGVQLEGTGGCPNVSFGGTTLDSNAGFGLLINSGMICLPDLSSLVYTNNANSNRIFLNAVGVPAGANPVISAAPVAYFVNNILNVGNGVNPSSLTVSPGATVAFADGTALDVQSGSSLTASSTGPTQEITFTTADSPAAPGKWGGIWFQAGSAGTLQYATVDDAGLNVFGTLSGVRVSSNALSAWNHVTLANNANTGLLVDGAGSVSITSSNFENGPAAGVIDNGIGGNVTATNNYWNASTGPTISTNSGGTGDAISGSDAAGVSFTPFVSSPN